MNSEILSFLNELSAEDARKILNLTRSKELKLKFKVEGSAKIETAWLANSALPNKFFLLARQDFKTFGAPATFKIQVGSDVYFFKTQILQDGKYFHLNLPFPIFRLIRRRHTRYLIPTNWNQSGTITSTEKKIFFSRVTLIELSLSGIKVHAPNELPRYEKLQKIKINFKVHRRAEIEIQGYVRHMSRPKSGGQTLGIEFIGETKLIQNKIQNLCDDLVHASA